MGAKKQSAPKAAEGAAGLPSYLSAYQPGDSDIEMPLLDGGVIRFRKFRRYAELEQFNKAREAFAKRALGGGIPELAGIEGLTKSEALAVYTLHTLAVEPEIPLSHGRFLIEAPFFITYAIEWLNQNMLESLGRAFHEQIEAGK